MKPYGIARWVAIRSELLSAAFNAGLAAYLVYGSSLDASDIGFTLSVSGTSPIFTCYRYCHLVNPSLSSGVQQLDTVVGKILQ